MDLLIGLLLGLLLGALFGVLGYKFYRVQIKAKRNLRTRAELQGNRVSTVAPPHASSSPCGPIARKSRSSRSKAPTRRPSPSRATTSPSR